ncbi:MAG: MFS transporter [Actinobacteria bacterium]|nr:MAG: MFS transporter [Actinomycetota bacterium]
MPSDEKLERLQKVLAAAGVGSRRACEELIVQGRVTVNGRVARIGDKVDAETAEIYVDGDRVVTNRKLVYLAFNKPRGVVSTMADEKGRAAISDYLGQVTERVYHVGRLDADSEGLLLLTNDGDLAHRLMHPSFEIPKTYRCEVVGPISRRVGRQLLAGVELDDGPAKVDAFRVIDTFGKAAHVEVVLHEGRKHIVRRMFDAVGHPVTRLIRIAIGSVRLGNLRPGHTRVLSNAEIAELFRMSENAGGATGAGRAGRSRRGGDGRVVARAERVERPGMMKDGSGHVCPERSGRSSGRAGAGGPGKQPARRSGGGKGTDRTDRRRR